MLPWGHGASPYILQHVYQALLRYDRQDSALHFHRNPCKQAQGTQRNAPEGTACSLIKGGGQGTQVSSIKCRVCKLLTVFVV